MRERRRQHEGEGGEVRKREQLGRKARRGERRETTQRIEMKKHTWRGRDIRLKLEVNKYSREGKRGREIERVERERERTWREKTHKV